MFQSPITGLTFLTELSEMFPDVHLYVSIPYNGSYFSHETKHPVFWYKEEMFQSPITGLTFLTFGLAELATAIQMFQSPITGLTFLT